MQTTAFCSAAAFTVPRLKQHQQQLQLSQARLSHLQKDLQELEAAVVDHTAAHQQAQHSPGLASCGTAPLHGNSWHTASPAGQQRAAGTTAKSDDREGSTTAAAAAAAGHVQEERLAGGQAGGHTHVSAVVSLQGSNQPPLCKPWQSYKWSL